MAGNFGNQYRMELPPDLAFGFHPEFGTQPRRLAGSFDRAQGQSPDQAAQEYDDEQDHRQDHQHGRGGQVSPSDHLENDEPVDSDGNGADSFVDKHKREQEFVPREQELEYSNRPDARRGERERYLPERLEVGRPSMNAASSSSNGRSSKKPHHYREIERDVSEHQPDVRVVQAQRDVHHEKRDQNGDRRGHPRGQYPEGEIRRAAEPVTGDDVRRRPAASRAKPAPCQRPCARRPDTPGHPPAGPATSPICSPGGAAFRRCADGAATATIRTRRSRRKPAPSPEAGSGPSSAAD